MKLEVNKNSGSVWLCGLDFIRKLLFQNLHHSRSIFIGFRTVDLRPPYTGCDFFKIVNVFFVEVIQTAIMDYGIYMLFKVF